MIRIGIEIDRHGKQLIELDRQYEDLLLAELPTIKEIMLHHFLSAHSFRSFGRL